MKKFNILVCGNDTRSFLSVVRSLGRNGYTIFVAPSDLSAPALSSKFISETVYLPPYECGKDEWIDGLKKCISKYEIDLIIPCDDRTFIPLTINREHFESLTKLAIVEDRAFDAFFDKWETRNIARECDVPVAAGKLLSSEDTYDSLNDLFGSEFIVKARKSFSDKNLTVRGSVTFVRSEQNFNSISQKGENQLLVESLFPGYGGGISVLACKGEVVAAFQHKRLHEGVSGGSSFRESEQCEKSLLNAVERMCSNVELDGVAMFEYRRNESGEWILLEVNCRFWGSLPLAVASGVDFPAYLADYLSGIKNKSDIKSQCMPKLEPSYTVGMRARNFSGEWWYYRNKMSELSLIELPAFIANEKVTFFKNVFRKKETIDSFAFDDIKPFFSEVFILIYDLYESIIFKIPFLFKYRKNYYRKKLKKELKQKSIQSIEFVCQGNIYRSVFSEVVLKKLVKEKGHPIAVGSSGTLPFPGRQSPKSALDAANSFGIDLKDHRSRFCTQERIHQSDLVFVFDRQTKHKFSSLHPGKKPFYLFDLLDGGPSIEMTDPYGTDDSHIKSVYSRIYEAVQKLAQIVS